MNKYVFTFLLIVLFSGIIKAEDKITNFTPLHVNSIIYNNNYLWAGTENGLIKYDKYSDEYSTYNINNMPLETNIYPVTVSESGNIWVGIERNKIYY